MKQTKKQGNDNQVAGAQQYLVITVDNKCNHQCWFANSRKTAVSTANDAIKAFRDNAPYVDEWEVDGDFRSGDSKRVFATDADYIKVLDVTIYDCQRIPRKYRR